MPTLSDRQRVELAIPAFLLLALTAAPGIFVPVGPDQATTAQTDIAALRANLQLATVEPFEDLPLKKKQALLRRVERIGKAVIVEWTDRSALSVMLTVWYFLKDLTDREVLILWEGSAMDSATRKLLPMFEHGFAEQTRDALAQEHARQLLADLQLQGMYG